MFFPLGPTRAPQHALQTFGRDPPLWRHDLWYIPQWAVLEHDHHRMSHCQVTATELRLSHIYIRMNANREWAITFINRNTVHNYLFLSASRQMSHTRQQPLLLCTLNASLFLILLFSVHGNYTKGVGLWFAQLEWPHGHRLLHYSRVSTTMILLYPKGGQSGRHYIRDIFFRALMLPSM